MTRLMTPAEVVADHIERSGLRQLDWAGKLGYSEKHISQVIHGHKRVSISFAVKFGRLSGINPRLLLHLQADHDLRKYLLEEADEIAGGRHPSTVVGGPEQLARPQVESPGRQRDRRVVRNPGSRRPYTG